MATQITIRPPQPLPQATEPVRHLSPYQQRMAKAPEIVNDDFLGNFADILDVINPLQHIPGVSTAYRELTGDEVSSGARIAGGALFGGPLGLFASIFSAIIEEHTGGDIGEHLFAAATSKYDQTTKLAS
ncbi:MAG: hypothetical protein ACN2B6_08580 [Rickettsiales bacterium]